LSPETRRPTAGEVSELRRLCAMVYGNDGPEHVAHAVDLALADVDRALTCYRELARRYGFEVRPCARDLEA
jgi:hypothetical protein